MGVDKVRENRIRRKLNRMGYRLSKSRRKDPDAYDYGGYMITNIYNHVIYNGEGHNAYMLSIEDVEEWIKEETSK